MTPWALASRLGVVEESKASKGSDLRIAKLRMHCVGGLGCWQLTGRLQLASESMGGGGVYGI